MFENKPPQKPLLDDLETAEKNPEIFYKIQLAALRMGRKFGFSDTEMEKTLGIRLHPEDRQDKENLQRSPAPPPSLSADHLARLDSLCRNLSIHRLLIMGDIPASAPPEIVVDWPPAMPSQAASRFFALSEGLEAIFGQSVVLIELGAVTQSARKDEIARNALEAWHA
ncbi:MAG TPA: hypothetical protein DCW68_03490 [Rhodospirillaceae bacterium]|nr:MAG: hypothetical protein A2018_07570 [Alphaproteobacteria bacterium GWF2_58_20]HAU29157.1 hypothetical protein [Rhodospirillaceae bacterium]